MTRAVAICACVLGWGCAGGEAAMTRLVALEASLPALAAGGARTCAPRELALAEAHAAFARMELRQGSVERAREHLTEAEVQVGAARILSPLERCAPRPAPCVQVPQAPGCAPPGASPAPESVLTAPVDGEKPPN